MPEEIYKKIFSRNLLYYMALNQKTQTDLVNDLKFNKSAVSTWCNGTRLPRMDKVDSLAKYFNINRSDLIEDKKKAKDDEKALYYLNDKTRQVAKVAFDDPDFYFLAEIYHSVPSDMKKRISAYAKNVFQLCEAENVLNAAHSRTDISDAERTQEAKKAEEDIMDDPNF